MAFTSSQPPSFSPSSSTPTRWDVFLSFRGSDTRLNFTSYLYSALARHGIQTFMDDRELRPGEDIPDALPEAIKESKTYIVVFSENYASSSWCLDELVEILNCNKTTGRLIIPVFYKIKPGIVRHQTGTFKEALEKHESRFAAEMEKAENLLERIEDRSKRIEVWRERVEGWRSSLIQVGDKSGKEIDGTRYEPDIIEEIVKILLIKIKPTALPVAKYPVGLESRVKDITSLLSSDTEGVINIGDSSQPSSSSAASFSTPPPTTRDVFLSFCSADTRNKFTSHLYYALESKGILTVDPELSSRKVISDALTQAIQESKIYVIVLSESYASSSWCLDVLVEILNCYKKMNRLVIPVFYHIYPSVVRSQLGSFKEAFKKHEYRSPEKMEMWRSALAEVAVLAGYLFSKDRSQVDIMDKVVDRVLRAKNTLPLDGVKYSVGLDSRVKDINEFLISSSSSLYTRWDVFLNFRGSDTRYGFIDFLIDALNRAGIRTFRDDMISSGEVLSRSLIQGIHESEAYIVVLSENFANSTWCLDELVEILKCHRTMKRLVIPVSYDIEPRCVRHQTGSFKKAFERHESRFGMERVNEWVLALTELDNLSHIVVREYRSEASVVTDIVCRLLDHITPKTLDVAKYQVGLDSRAAGVTYRSDTRDVIKFGIYGMIGVGKTTLAKFLFNQLLLRGNFRDSSFLENVKIKGLESLQQKLINDVIKSKEKFEVDNVGEGIKLIRERICSEKILVLADDIDRFEQYESLVGPFASGSVVIVTTRDEKILDKIGVQPKYRYKVKTLEDPESLELFTKHAFRDAEPDETLMVLSKHILRLASGLPLALEVYGSHLYKRTAEEWEYYIDKLQRNPNSSVQENFIISLDLLEKDNRGLKEIFLDIACFFIGRKKAEVVKILKTQYSNAGNIINILKENCILTISSGDVLGMHDLLGDIGREIARNGSPTEPKNPSRLWQLEDITNVLEMYEYKETKVIEAIIPSNFYYPNSFEGVSFNVKAFKRMRKLRFLYLKYVTLTGKFKQKFENLRWLCWEYCPLKCLPCDFYPHNLVILEFPHSEMRTMWEPNMVHVFNKLKTLNMKYSLHLITTPDFKHFPFLETLNMEYCEGLKEVHVSIGSLERLVSLDLHGCVNLRSLPDSICTLRSVKSLNIGGCSTLEALPIELGNIESIMELNVEKLTVSKLPDSIRRLSKLVELILSDNKNLKTLPELPPTLKCIKADGCTSLEKLPNLLDLKQVEILVLTDCHGLTEIQDLTELTSLTEIHFRGCNSSVLTHTFTERFFQILSGFGHQINFYIGSEEFPDWISQSRNIRGPIMSLALSQNVSQNVSHNLSGMILCFKHLEGFDLIEYSVENTTSGFILQGKLDNCNHDSLMVIVPTSIFPVTDGDQSIKLRTIHANILGIHPLYKDDEITTINKTSIEEERSYPSKRLKPTESDDN